THSYPLHLSEVITRTGPNGESMHIGFARVVDMLTMYKEMGQRFFDRNIRAALPEVEAVNRSLTQAFKRIVLDEKDSPFVFPFNHNGITISAESLEVIDRVYKITEPRLLNGAQTITTLDRFLKQNKGNYKLESRRQFLEEIVVLCKVVTNAQQEFITTVTINNNRQTPVEPWNLRANDHIQLEIQDKMQDDLQVYYERQENAFANLSDEDLEERGITQYKAVELRRLAQTFLVSDGEIDKMQRFRDVFEDDKLYAQVFNQSRLKADSRKILLCYKVQFRLRRLLNDIVEKGANKYAYIHRGRNLLWALLCQGILNDSRLESYAESFGNSLSLEADYTEWLSAIATNRCRFLIGQIVDDGLYAAKAAEGNYSFLRTNAAYNRCMDDAYKKYKWVKKSLR
ncbi:MAG: AIPR family protein, partial [Acidobacteria bacterium]|nr:AIPR family protein [Acidobacteriota bacterium]